MVHLSRSHVKSVRSFTPEGIGGNSGWRGVPGARHIPAVNDPSFKHFTQIVAEWKTADIELTEPLMAAAAQLAKARAAKVDHEAARLADLKPGAFGDAKTGVIYYIRRGKYVKIGTTTRLRSRMRDLMPDEVLAVEPGSYALEGALHARFSSIRFASWCEYFALTPELQEHIDGVLAKHGPAPSGLCQFNAQG